MCIIHGVQWSISAHPQSVDPLCVEKMHDSWWLYSGIRKSRPNNMEIEGQKCTAIYEVASNLGALNSY